MPEREDTEAESLSDSAATEMATDATDIPGGPVGLDASADTAEIVVGEDDHTSGIVDQLEAREDLVVRVEPLDVADYVVSKQVGIKRLRLQHDHTLTDEGMQVLVDQLKTVAEGHSQPVLMLEREIPEAETPSDVLHEFRARLIPEHLNLLETGSASETAALLAMIARREQTATSTARSLHQGTQAKTLAEQQEYVVASITDLGPITASTLLEHFSNVEGVVSASKADLLEVPGIGEELAERIREVVSSGYKGPPR